MGSIRGRVKPLTIINLRECRKITSYAYSCTITSSNSSITLHMHLPIILCYTITYSNFKYILFWRFSNSVKCPNISLFTSDIIKTRHNTEHKTDRCKNRGWQRYNYGLFSKENTGKPVLKGYFFFLKLVLTYLFSTRDKGCFFSIWL